MFSSPEIKANKYGEASEKVYNDVDDIKEILEVIKSSPVRVVDNLVLSQDSSKIKTALMVGPMIYGTGHGAINKRTIQCPELTKYALQNGQLYMIGKGESVWSNVHIHDLGKLFALLLQAAVEKRDGMWNENGVFLPENGSMVSTIIRACCFETDGSQSFGEVARQIARTAHEQKLIKSEEVRSVRSEDANSIMPHGAVLLGTNAQLKSLRARRDLGWEPSAISLTEDIPLMVKGEAARLKG